MVTATVFKDPTGYVSFECRGHSGYAKKGSDIVCSAISALTINAANSIMTLTDTKISVSETDGFLSWEFDEKCSENAKLLMDSLLIGLKSIEEEYGKYVKLEIKEVSHDQVEPSVIRS